MTDDKTQDTGVTREDAALEVDLVAEGIELTDGDEPKVETTPEGDASTKKTEEPKQEPKREKTYTEAELQRIVQERVKNSAKAKQVVDYLKQMGWENEDQLIAQLETEVNTKKAQQLGVGDVNALRQFINEEVSRHPTVTQAQKVVQDSKLQSQVTELLRRYPDASQDEIKEAYSHMTAANLPTLHAAYLDKFAPAIEEKIRKRALDAQVSQAKRGVEGSSDPATNKSEPALKASKEDLEWANRRVKQGEYKDVREAIRSLNKNKTRKH